MPVYVDDFRAVYRGMFMSHMVADTIEELHSMADRIGLRRQWFQNHKGSIPHYDVCWSKRKLAIENGAVEITAKELVITFGYQKIR